MTQINDLACAPAGAGAVYLAMTADLVVRCGLVGAIALADLPRLAAAVGDMAALMESRASYKVLERLVKSGR